MSPDSAVYVSGYSFLGASTGRFSDEIVIGESGLFLPGSMHVVTYEHGRLVREGPTVGVPPHALVVFKDGVLKHVGAPWYIQGPEPSSCFDTLAD